MLLHHVQLSMPRGGEDEARRFYVTALGLTEVSKPPGLAGRGGCWFRAPLRRTHDRTHDNEFPLELHLGVEEPFVPAAKAHPALLLESVADLEDLAGRIEHAGYEVSWAERTTFDGFERFHCRDGFGNRIEVLTAAA